MYSNRERKKKNIQDLCLHNPGYVSKPPLKHAKNNQKSGKKDIKKKILNGHNNPLHSLHCVWPCFRYISQTESKLKSFGICRYSMTQIDSGCISSLKQNRSLYFLSFFLIPDSIPEIRHILFPLDIPRRYDVLSQDLTCSWLTAEVKGWLCCLVSWLQLWVTSNKPGPLWEITAVLVETSSEMFQRSL